MSQTLTLANIRSSLIRQEDTIIFQLIERAQYARNAPVYEAEGVPVPGARGDRPQWTPARSDSSTIDNSVCGGSAASGQQRTLEEQEQRAATAPSDRAHPTRSSCWHQAAATAACWRSCSAHAMHAQ